MYITYLDKLNHYTKPYVIFAFYHCNRAIGIYVLMYSIPKYHMHQKEENHKDYKNSNDEELIKKS